MVTNGMFAAAAAVAAAAVWLSTAPWMDGTPWSPLLVLPVEPGDAVLVTGGSSGIGKHAALSLAREGYTVFACVRKERDGAALLESAARLLPVPGESGHPAYTRRSERARRRAAAAGLKPILLDVTDEEQVERAVGIVSDFVGEKGLKGLFNNAGIALSGETSSAVEYTDLAVYRRTMDVNFLGTVRVTKAFLPLLRRYGSNNDGRGSARIVMNTSLAGILAPGFMSAYASSKYAVEAFADSLRRELLPDAGVDVSLLEPGHVATPILDATVPDGVEPYRDAERGHWNGFWKLASRAPTPRVTSDAVIHAMRSRRPRIRYRAGLAAGVVPFVACCVPAVLADYFVTYPIRWLPALTDDEAERLQRVNEVDFEL